MLAAALSAPVYAEGMSYTYIEGAYTDTEIDGSGVDVDGDGLSVSGAFELTDNLFLTAGYGNQDFDQGVDLDQWFAGIGGHLPLTDTVDVVGTLAYVDAELDTGFGDADDEGYSAGLGLRARVLDNLEVEGGVTYIDLGDDLDDTALNLGGRYYFTDTFALGAGYSRGDDVDSWNVSVRLEF